MSKIFLKIFSIGVIALSCVEHKERNPILQGLVIRTGLQCGWCGGSDSLTLTRTESFYQYNSVCNEKNKYRHELTDAERWSNLLAKLDWDKFRLINAKTCEICVDRCDTWVSIQKDDVIYKIHYGETSTGIEALKPFMKELDAWRVDFKVDRNVNRTRIKITSI